MTVVGLDLSLTATGVAVGNTVDLIAFPKLRGPERLQAIRDAVIGACDEAELVVIEGYNMGAGRGTAHGHALGELGGVVRLSLWERDIAYTEVPPASLKKYATGRGNADKGAMLAEAIRQLGYQGHDHNEADALWLQQLGLARLGRIQVTKARQAEVAKITWPDLTAVA